MAGYERAAAAELSPFRLCSKIEELLLDCLKLQRMAERDAWEGARNLLRMAILELAALPAGNHREYRRKFKALRPDSIAASELPAAGIAMVAVAIERDRMNWDPTVDAVALDPAMRARYARQAGFVSFEAFASGTELMRRDCDRLIQLGRFAEAERLRAIIPLDALRAVGVPAVSPREAARKASFVSVAGGACAPLSLMLDAAMAFERRRWSIIPDGSTETFAPEASDTTPDQRFATYRGFPDPTSLTQFIDGIATFARDLAILRAHGEAALITGALVSMIHAGFAAAAVPARSRPEAERKVEDLTHLLYDLGRDHPLPTEMLTAAIAWECDRWKIELIVASEVPSGEVH